MVGTTAYAAVSTASARSPLVDHFHRQATHNHVLYKYTPVRSIFPTVSLLLQVSALLLIIQAYHLHYIILLVSIQTINITTLLLSCLYLRSAAGASAAGTHHITVKKTHCGCAPISSAGPRLPAFSCSLSSFRTKLARCLCGTSVSPKKETNQCSGTTTASTV